MYKIYFKDNHRIKGFKPDYKSELQSHKADKYIKKEEIILKSLASYFKK